MSKMNYENAKEKQMRDLAKVRILLFINITALILVLMLLIATIAQPKVKPKVIKHYQTSTTGGVEHVISSYLKAGAKNKIKNLECISITTTPEPVLKQEVQSISFNANDTYMLTKIAMAEAEGESTKCKALVILTVLNRVASNEFPDTIHDVIFQSKQFSPIASGRYNSVEPSEDCYKALEMVCSGYNESQGSLYFEACKSKDNWLSRNLQFLFEVDKTRFYK